MTNSLHKVFIAALVFFSTALNGQYVVGPPSRSLKFRIYGKDARPITEKSRDYKIEVTLDGDKKNRNAECYPSFSGDFIRVTTSGRLGYGPVNLSIGHGTEAMHVKTAGNIDSLPFTAGQYEIPPNFNPLFEEPTLKKLKISNRNLDYFQGTNGTEVLKKVHFDKKLKGHFIGGYYFSEKDKTLIFLEQTNDLPKYQFVISHDNGNEWKQVPIRAMREKDQVKRLEASFGHIFLLLEREEYNKNGDAKNFLITSPLVLKCDVNGNVSTDSVLTSLKIYSLKFINERLGFALGRAENKSSNFYRTLNGGRTWEQMYTTMKVEEGSVGYFSDAQHGFLVAKNYKDNVYYSTGNGGRSWVKYDPPVRSLQASKNDPVYVNRSCEIYSGDEQPSVLIVGEDKKVYKVNPGLENTWRVLSPGKEVTLIMCSDYLLCSTDNRKTWKFFPYSFSAPAHNFYGVRGIGFFDACMLNEEQVLLCSSNGIYTFNLSELK